jgi:hypothetical protein
MPSICRHFLCATLLILLLLPATAACVPAAVEPETTQTSAPVVETLPALAAYPGAEATETPPPYPPLYTGTSSLYGMQPTSEARCGFTSQPSPMPP